jgi:hypothetical protein
LNWRRGGIPLVEALEELEMLVESHWWKRWWDSTGGSAGGIPLVEVLVGFHSGLEKADHCLDVSHSLIGRILVETVLRSTQWIRQWKCLGRFHWWKCWWKPTGRNTGGIGDAGGIPPVEALV